MTESEPTTERGKRGIGLPAPLLGDLRAHRQAQLAERLAAGDQWHDTDLIFCQPNGKPIDLRRDWGRWAKLLEEAGMPHVPARRPAHRREPVLLAQGIPARVVMEILGHSTIAVTQNIYQHVMPEAVSSATSAVADVLWSEASGHQAGTTADDRQPR